MSDLRLTFKEVDKTNSHVWQSVLQFLQVSLFSSDDLLDAYALYEYLALRAIRKNTASDVFIFHADKIMNMMMVEDFLAAKLRAQIESAFGLRDLGRSRAKEEFSDF